MHDPTTFVAGETLVDFIPDRPGALADVESFSPRPGGAPANVAVALSRLDAAPYFCTRIATDQFGDFLADALEDEGVPTRFVQRDDDRATTLAFVTHDPDADRAFTFYRENAADEHIAVSPVPDDVLASVDRVAVGGYVLTTDPGRTAMFDLVERAAAHDCTIVFDPNSRPELWPAAADPERVLDEMLAHTDVVKASAEDFAWLDYPTDEDALADRLLAAGAHTVLLTRGGAGAVAYTTERAPWGAGEWHHDGYRVDPVDTTGAGDAFLGGALAALAADAAPDELLAFANAVAALTTTAAGAWPALPSRDAVREFRAERD